ncbi:MAG TPA: caspase family protein [Pyrinomonadaceae bacterium]|nr:caspase family protein [Pyrinomonadaceae bacterium]
MMCHKFTKLFALSALLLVSTAAFGQDRTPFALELPELNTGQLRKVNNYIARTDVNIVKFWIADPYAAVMNWSDIKVVVNTKAATTVCHQRAASSGKMLLCDLNRLVGFKLDGNKNVFEIEAKTKDGTRYFASFVMLTDRNLAADKGPLKFSGRKFAVIIGVSEYKNNDAGLTDLAFADKDAEALFQLLTRGGFNPNDILFLTNERATLSAVRDSLGRFLTRAASTDMILFFLAGHGTPDPYDKRNLYFLVHDSKVADLRNTALPMLELKQMIDSKLQAKRAVFLLDTCHSAGVSGTKIISKPSFDSAQQRGLLQSGTPAASPGGGKKTVPDSDARQLVLGGNNVNDFLAKQLFNQEGRAVLTSSDVNETSVESTVWGGGHGVFTWALLEGLRGLADANTDKIVTAGELFDYVSNRVRKETRNKQNPRALPGLSSGLEVSVIR